MKKTILISIIVSALILMTSCLGEVSNRYDETSFVYIAMDDNLSVYGKTISVNTPPRVITATEMLSMDIGSFNLMTYSWDEEYGTKSLSVDGQLYQADFVRLTDESVAIEDKVLKLSQLSEVGESQSIISIEPFFYSHSPEYTGDKWLFQYSYDRPKDKTADIEFYKREDEEGSSDNIVIDIHLTYADTPEVASRDNVTEYLALDMSAIRDMYEGSSSTNTKDLKVVFVYKVEGRNEPIETQPYTLQVKGD